MNKLIKFIFASLFFLFISINAEAATYTISQITNSPKFDSADQACAYFKTRYASAVSYQVTHSETWCELYDSFERLAIGTIVKDESCPSTVSTNPISVPGWTNWTIDQIDQYQNKIQSSTVCYQGCRYKNPALTGSEGSDMMSLQYGEPTTDASCPNTTNTPPTIPPDNYEPPQTDCKNSAGSDSYCTKPSTGCPTGYSSGTYNGQQICIKNSNTNPNPNDPNNQTDPPDPKPNTGDMSGVINAINNAKNELKAAIQAQTNALSASIEQQTTDIKQSISAQTYALTNAINASTNSIKESLASGFKNVTDAIGLTNAKIDQTNQKLDDTNSKLNEIKSTNNQIRDNINVTNQKLEDVKQNQQQTNSKLDDIKKNTADTNKALSDIKSNGDQVKDGIDQANGHLSSIDANGKATNGKLDGLKEGQEEGNGLLRGIKDLLSEIKDFLTEEPELEDSQLQVQEEDVTQFETTDYFNFGGSCPFNGFSASIPMGAVGSLNFNSDLSFFCSFAEQARPFIRGLGYLLCLIYLIQWVRNGNG